MAVTARTPPKKRPQFMETASLAAVKCCLLYPGTWRMVQQQRVFWGRSHLPQVAAEEGGKYHKGLLSLPSGDHLRQGPLGVSRPERAGLLKPDTGWDLGRVLQSHSHLLGCVPLPWDWGFGWHWTFMVRISLLGLARTQL